MGAEDVAGCLLQDGQVEGEMAVPDVGGEHGGADSGEGVWGLVGVTGRKDAVFVCFAKGGVAGVKVLGGLFEGEDTDGGWESAIEGEMEVGRGDGSFEGEGCDLGEGVDASVCTSGALGKHSLSGDLVDGLGKCSLYGGQTWLDLPAVEGRAVVGEDGFPKRHDDDLDGITMDGKTSDRGDFAVAIL